MFSFSLVYLFCLSYFSLYFLYDEPTISLSPVCVFIVETSIGRELPNWSVHRGFRGGKKEGRARIPGVGGVEPREGIPLSPRFPEDPPRAE